MGEPLPLATIQRAVFEFLRGRTDCAVFGAQAVNAYAAQTRATEDVDIASPRAEELAEELRRYFNEKFHIAVRVRSVRGGIGFRVYQLRKNEPNRHLVDLRPVAELPPTQEVDGVLVVSPAEAIANKLQALHSRGHKPKAGTDSRDLTMLLLTFPDLKTEQGPVRERLEAVDADPAVFELWRDWVHKTIEPEDEDDEFDW